MISTHILSTHRLSGPGYTQALSALLPPKKPDLDPRPEVVDTPAFEAADPSDVRARSSFGGAEADFLNRHAYSAFQFGADEEEAWTDDDDDGESYDEDGPRQPECQTQ